MYVVRVIRPDGIIIRTAYVDCPPAPRCEAAFLADSPGCWLDVSREPEEILEDEQCAWEDDDYDACWDGPTIVDACGPVQPGFIFCDGKLTVDPWGN